MKNRNKLFGIIAIAAITGFIMAACGGGDKTPVVTDVIIKPHSPYLIKGDSMTFTAEVTGIHNPVLTVTWEIADSHGHPGAEIDADGKLTVSENYPEDELVIKAVSTADNDKSAETEVVLLTPTSLEDFTHGKLANGELSMWGYKGTSTSFIIPVQVDGIPVTAIRDGSFSSGNLTSLVIPNSVTTIGRYAFSHNQLTNLIIGSSVTTIGDGAFDNNQLTNVVIPDSVTTIGVGAFAWNQLTNIVIPDSVTTIGDHAFEYNQLTSLSIGNSVTEIGEGAFFSNQLTNVVIPDSVITIGDRAFETNQLTSFSIGSGVTAIGENVFAENPDLAAINVSPNNQHFSSINGILYNKNAAILILCPVGKTGSITIPGSVTEIGDRAFVGCRLTNIVIPGSVTEIGEGAFANSQLTDVTIGNGVTTIGAAAFAWNQLTNIVIPGSVTTIGAAAFAWNQLTNIVIPGSVTEIGEGAFFSNQLTNVVIPGSVTEIGGGAFGLNQLISVTIGANVELGDMAFNDTETDSSGFEDKYDEFGKAAGTYTRADTGSIDWSWEP